MTDALKGKLEHVKTGLLVGTVPTPSKIHEIFEDIQALLYDLDLRVKELETGKVPYMEPRGN